MHSGWVTLNSQVHWPKIKKNIYKMKPVPMLKQIYFWQVTSLFQFGRDKKPTLKVPLRSGPPTLEENMPLYFFYNHDKEFPMRQITAHRFRIILIISEVNYTGVFRKDRKLNTEMSNSRPNKTREGASSIECFQILFQ